MWQVRVQAITQHTMHLQRQAALVIPQLHLARGVHWDRQWRARAHRPPLLAVQHAKELSVQV